MEGPIEVAAATDAAVVPYALDGVALLLPLLDGEVPHVDLGDDGVLSPTVGAPTLRCDADAV